MQNCAVAGKGAERDDLVRSLLLHMKRNGGAAASIMAAALVLFTWVLQVFMASRRISPLGAAKRAPNGWSPLSLDSIDFAIALRNSCRSRVSNEEGICSDNAVRYLLHFWQHSFLLFVSSRVVLIPVFDDETEMEGLAAWQPDVYACLLACSYGLCSTCRLAGAVTTRTDDDDTRARERVNTDSHVGLLVYYGTARL